MVDCPLFDPMHCTLIWAINSLKLIIPMLISGWIGYKIGKHDALHAVRETRGEDGK